MSCFPCWPWLPAQGLGVALIPPMLVEAELARGELVVACAQPLRGRAQLLPGHAQRHARRPALGLFCPAWLSQDGGAADLKGIGGAQPARRWVVKQAFRARHCHLVAALALGVVQCLVRRRSSSALSSWRLPRSWPPPGTW